ncbi:MAG: hypothetical protein H0W20_04455 [Chthoniobacterales bacterium]|nr:hypothetical protein [Chthoniobacterales bacterium]
MHRHFASSAFYKLVVAAIVLAAAAILPHRVSAQQIVRVTDSAGLQAAIRSVTDGGVIELAAGTYAAPTGGFTISDVATTRSFTIKSAAGTSPILSGGGSRDILRLVNRVGSSSRPVTFEGLTFADGFSGTNQVGGALTVTRAHAIFISCLFRNNVANASVTGGGGLWIDHSTVSFRSCTWSDNSSRNYGGGVSVYQSRVFLRDCIFKANRTNVANHVYNAQGGAIANSNSEVRIDDSRFENNHAGYVGGAIFCGAEWREPYSTPTAQLIVTNSVFVGNSAAAAPGIGTPSAPIGGAVHLEDQTTGRFVNCRFLNNSAGQAGALSSYRANTEIDRCVFDANVAVGPDAHGGSIYADSSDLPDSSTNNGAATRPPLVLTVRDSIFKGRAGVPSAAHGGGIYVSGDLNSAYGRRGMQQNGSEDSNRTRVTLTRVAFVDLATTGTAGALSGAFVNLRMENSIVANCSTNGSGAGLRFQENSAVTIDNSTVARCKSGELGAGITMFSGKLDVTNTTFVQNQNGGGRGAAITTVPSSAGDGLPDMDMTGVVKDCLFAANSGDTALYSGDRALPPFNRLQYGGNRFAPGTDRVFISDFGNVHSVSTMNLFQLPRSDGSLTILSPSPNILLNAQPVAKALLKLPSSIARSGGPGEAMPTPSYVVYASHGAAAILDDAQQIDSAGVIGTTSDFGHTLSVGSESISTSPPAGAALNISTRLRAGTGENALIGGFIIVGNAPKRVIIRAVGGSSGVSGALQDPKLELFDANRTNIATNDNWRSTQIGGAVGADQVVEIHASSVAPANELEPAIIATLDPNMAYTAVVSGANDATGVALVEVYDLDGPQTSTLANISTRGLIQNRDNVMIGGFIYAGGIGATNVVVRAIGPSLAANGIGNGLPDPVLEMFDGNGSGIASNDDWKTNQAAIERTGLAPRDDRESTVLLSGLPRGPYTAVVKDRDGRAGVGIVEVYVFR